MKELVKHILKSNRSGVIELPDSFAERQGTIILESTHMAHGLGGQSFLCTDPCVSISGSGGMARISVSGRESTRECHSPAELVRLIKALEREHNVSYFAAGYIGYEFACSAIAQDYAPRTDSLLPDFWFGLYDGFVRIDQANGSVTVAGKNKGIKDNLFSSVDPAASYVVPQSTRHVIFAPALSRMAYGEDVRSLLHYIHEGDIYQANYTMRFSTRTDLSPWACYRRLRWLNPAPYGAYIMGDGFSVISSSPERLIRRERKFLDSRPIKGTRPRGLTPVEDGRFRQELVQSTKDKAELLMITDLIRNDLGKVAVPGSVAVRELFALESYSAVHHLVSYVEAELEDGAGSGEVLEALLPGGSITGAPKKRAVEILRELEPHGRDVYTGAIGYFYEDKCDFNVAIRTLVERQGEYYAYAGGGIVADSDPDEEYEEVMVKARNLFRAVSDSYEVNDGRSCCIC